MISGKCQTLSHSVRNSWHNVKDTGCVRCLRVISHDLKTFRGHPTDRAASRYGG